MELPPELLLGIFEFLDAKSLCKCSSVCNYWNELSQNNEIWENLYKKYFRLFTYKIVRPFSTSTINISIKVEDSCWKSLYQDTIVRIGSFELSYKLRKVIINPSCNSDSRQIIQFKAESQVLLVQDIDDSQSEYIVKLLRRNSLQYHPKQSLYYKPQKPQSYKKSDEV